MEIVVRRIAKKKTYTIGRLYILYRAQNEAYKIEKTKKWEKSMNDRELER